MDGWRIITGEYAPQQGGVADFAALQAEALASAGDAVEVHVPDYPLPPSPSQRAHPLPDRFGPGTVLALAAAQARDRRVMLLHHSPFNLGVRGLNLAFPHLLRAVPGPLVVLFHEVHFPVHAGQPLRHRLLGRTQRAMARALLARAQAVCVSTEAWTPLLRELGWRDEVIPCPIPSNILPPVPAPSRDGARAQLGLRCEGTDTLIGHFGTYGEAVAGPLAAVLPPLLAVPGRRALLLGRGAARFRERVRAEHGELGARLLVPGGQSPEEISLGLLACDVLLQPFVDGVTTRRTSLMAGLAHGRPVCANRGPLTEPAWDGLAGLQLAPSPAPAALVEAAEALLAQPAAWPGLGDAARRSYDTHFSLDRGLAALRRASAQAVRA
jgi:glycosyltransferase involved in cell wall biosynthesis